MSNEVLEKNCEEVYIAFLDDPQQCLQNKEGKAIFDKSPSNVRLDDSFSLIWIKTFDPFIF